MIALVKGPLFYFLQMFPNCSDLQFWFRFSTLIPNLVHSITHSSCVTVTLQVTDE